MAAKKVKKKTIKKSDVAPRVAASSNGLAGLRKWNIRLGGLLVLQAIAIIVIGGSQTVPITAQYLATNTLASEASGHQVLAVATRHLMDIPLSWLVAKFLLIFAVTYLAAATVWRDKYEAWLARGVNKLRWLAFGVGGGAMAAVGAMLVGVTDIAYLWLIFGMVVLAAVLALAVELLGPGRRLRRLLAVGAIFATVLVWVVFKVSLLAGMAYNGSLPTFVYYIYGSMLLFTVALGAAVYMRLKLKGKWADSLQAERMFMLLGFVAASVLAWQIFAGALQP